MKNKSLITRKTRYFLYTLLIIIAFASCDRPSHHVYEGRQNMIVWKKKTIDEPKFGKYEYWITDASGQDWLLKSHQNFDVGDTIRISNCN